jgi:apolipoprotein N-acyltransferase
VRERRRAAAAIAAGALYAAAQPGAGAWPLAFVCLVPLFLALRGARARERALLGWLAGTVATTLATAAAGTAGAIRYYGLPPAAGVAVAISVGQVFGAATFVAFALLAGSASRAGPLAAVLRAASAFGAAELARSALLTGFPWLLLAYALLPAPALAQGAAVVGALGVSMLLAAVNAALAEALAARRARARARPALAALFALALLAWGGLFAPHAGGDAHPAAAGSAPAPGALRVLLVQHAPAGARRSAPAELIPALEKLRGLSRSRPDFDLAVWSENAVSAVMPENAHLLRGALPEGGRERALLFGAPRSDPARPGALHVSAFHADARGQLVAHHDKVHLLPFAEYAPGPLPMRWFGSVEVAPGEAPRALRFEGTAFGPLVCYEVLFAGLARDLARDGAGVLVNLSNDAWFGATGAIEQHLAAAMYRAIETRRPLLRATHTGVTAAIDARGRVAARLPLGVSAALSVDVTPGRGQAPAVSVGELPALLAALVALAFAARGALARARGNALDLLRAGGSAPARRADAREAEQAEQSQRRGLHLGHRDQAPAAGGRGVCARPARAVPHEGRARGAGQEHVHGAGCAALVEQAVQVERAVDDDVDRVREAGLEQRDAVGDEERVLEVRGEVRDEVVGGTSVPGVARGPSDHEVGAGPEYDARQGEGPERVIGAAPPERVVREVDGASLVVEELDPLAPVVGSGRVEHHLGDHEGGGRLGPGEQRQRRCERAPEEAGRVGGPKHGPFIGEASARS